MFFSATLPRASGPLGPVVLAAQSGPMHGLCNTRGLLASVEGSAKLTPADGA